MYFTYDLKLKFGYAIFIQKYYSPGWTNISMSVASQWKLEIAVVATTITVIAINH